MTMLLWYVIGYHGYTGMNLISGLEYTKDCVTTLCQVSSTIPVCLSIFVFQCICICFTIILFADT